MTKLITYVCGHCGSGRLRAAASVTWDNAAQRWVLASVDDTWRFCEGCGFYGVTFEEVALEGNDLEDSIARRIATGIGWSPGHTLTAQQYCNDHGIDYRTKASERS